MDAFVTPVMACLAFVLSLLIHELSHSTAAWIKGVARSPLSIRLLPYLCVPIAPDLEEDKYEALASRDKVFILVAGLAANLLMWGVAILVLSVLRSGLHPVLYGFVLFLALANLAEAASYTTVGAAHPISDIKALLAELPRLRASAIYIPSTFLAGLSVYLSSQLIPERQAVAYWAFFFSVYVLLSGSRIVLTPGGNPRRG
jgi:hypothetical protein